MESVFPFLKQIGYLILEYPQVHGIYYNIKNSGRKLPMFQARMDSAMNMPMMGELGGQDEMQLPGNMSQPAQLRKFLANMGINDKILALVFLLGFVCAMYVSNISVYPIVVILSGFVLFAAGFSIGLIRGWYRGDGNWKGFKDDGCEREVDERWWGKIVSLFGYACTRVVKGVSVGDDNRVVQSEKKEVKESVTVENTESQWKHPQTVDDGRNQVKHPRTVDGPTPGSEEMPKGYYCSDDMSFKSVSSQDKINEEIHDENRVGRHRGAADQNGGFSMDENERGGSGDNNGHKSRSGSEMPVGTNVNFSDDELKGGFGSRTWDDMEFNEHLKEANALLRQAKEMLREKYHDENTDAMLNRSAGLLSKAVHMKPMSLLALEQLGNTYLLHGEMKLRITRNLRNLLSARNEDPFSDGSGRITGSFSSKFSQNKDEIASKLIRAGKECEDLLVKAGRMYRLALSIDENNAKALYNWGLALSSRAQLISDIGPEAASDADKVYLAAIDKFDAVLSSGNAYSPDALFRWGVVLQQRSRLQLRTTREKVKLLKQAKRLYEDALDMDSRDPRVREALSACVLELNDDPMYLMQK